MAIGGLGGRFFALTIVGYAAALVTVAVAVRFASAPTLERMQIQALESHVQTKASVVRDFIDSLEFEARIMASDPRVKAFLIGETDRTAIVTDVLSSFSSFQQIRLFDYRGREAIRVRDTPPGSRFIPLEASEGLSTILAENSDEARARYRPGITPHDAQFLITVPVTSQGLTEGILVLESHVNLGHILSAQENSPATRLATGFQVRMHQLWNESVHADIAVQIPGTEIYLQIGRDANVVQTLGREMVWRVLAIVCGALLLPFLMMALVGIRSIVAPHRALERSREELAANQRELSELAQIAEMAHEAIIVTDTEERILWTNPAFPALTGFSEEEVIGKRPRDLLQGRDTDNETRSEIKRAVMEQRAFRTEIVNYRKDGTPYWICLSISPIRDTYGTVRRFAAISSDITPAKLAQARLEQARKETEHLALHDTLTGMANRRYLDQVLESEVTSDSPDRTLVRIDLDHFKHVNDTLGHAAGDHVLKVVAQILADGVDSTDLAARVGGDEFVILLGNGRTSGDGARLAERLLSEIQRDIEFEGHMVRIGASFGVCSAPRRAGRQRKPAYQRGCRTLCREDRRAKHDLSLHAGTSPRRARQTEGLGSRSSSDPRREFEAYFQPQFDATTHRLTGVEALARWNHPTLGTLLPASFLPIAEQLRLVRRSTG